MGRCGCASAPATGCAAVGTGCVDVTGAGTPASPFTIGLGAACLPVIVCTSSTRPAAPADGQPIYETDTGRSRTWTGSTWRLIDPNFAGVYASTDADIVQTNAGVCCSLTVNPPWASTDPFQVLIMGRLSVSGGANGDVWQGILTDTASSVYSESYFNLGGLAGRGTANFEPSFTPTLTAARTFEISIAAYQGAGGGAPSGPVTILDARYTIIHAVVFAV